MRLASRWEGFDESAKESAHGLWRRGDSIAGLAKSFGQPQPDVERAIDEVRTRRILDQKLAYIFDASFLAEDAARTILAPLPESPAGASRRKPPAGLPPYLASLYEVPLLNREQEAHLFRKMNFLKYQIDQLRKQIDPTQPRRADLDQIERLEAEAVAAKNQIIRANLRLVVSIVRKRLDPSLELFELISDGNMSLIQAVEKFDFARGFKFSTYASWAIIKNLCRTLPKEKNLRNRWVTGQDELFRTAADPRGEASLSESSILRNQELVQGMLGRLNDRERQILVGRYGLGGEDAQTLERLGRDLGITKERVRQIESRAQEKLRKYAQGAMPDETIPALEPARSASRSSRRRHAN